MKGNVIKAEAAEAANTNRGLGLSYEKRIQ